MPLHPPQRRLWFLAGYDPGSAAYNVALELELDEAVDADRLATALRGLVERHDVLRQVVRADGAGEPYAELVAVPDDLLTVLDGDHDEVEAALRQRARAPFDLAAGPALRCLLARAPGRAPVLQLVVHHVATDAWSEQVLVRELEALYAGEQLPGPVQYADVAGLGLDGADDDVRWWGARLDPPPAPLTIPTDRPRPPVAPVAGAEVPVRLDGAAVAAAARRAGTTPAAVLLAATRTLLHRALGVDDVTVGLPESGRLDPAQDDVVGCFVNTLAVRGCAGEADELGRAADDLREAMLHRAAPFDRVVEQVGPERDLSTTPLFQVLLNVHAGDPPSSGNGLVRARRHRTTGTAKFDLNLTVDAGQDEALLSYRTDLLDEQTALAWAGWFAAAVRSVTDGDDLRLGDDPLLDGGAPTPLAGTLLDLIEAAARARPGGTAVVAPDGDLRHADLWERSGALARHLVASGAAGRPVAVYVDRSADLVVGALACWRARSAYLPLDPAYPPERVAAGMTSAGCDHLLTHRALAQDVTAATVLLLDDPALYASAPDADLTDRPTGSDLAYVISTSGSTGAPKAVAVTHDGVVDYLGGALPRLGLDLAAGPSFALASTPAADLGMTCLLGALVTGGTLHLLDRSEASDPVRFARRVRAHAIDVVKLVPSHLEMLAAHGDLAAVLPERLLVLAGEAIPWTLVDAVLAARPDLPVHASYGPSETTVAVSWCDTVHRPGRPAGRHGAPRNPVPGGEAERARPAGPPAAARPGGRARGRRALGGAGVPRYRPRAVRLRRAGRRALVPHRRRRAGLARRADRRARSGRRPGEGAGSPDRARRRHRGVHRRARGAGRGGAAGGHRAPPPAGRLGAASAGSHADGVGRAGRAARQVAGLHDPVRRRGARRAAPCRQRQGRPRSAPSAGTGCGAAGSAQGRNPGAGGRRVAVGPRRAPDLGRRRLLRARRRLVRGGARGDRGRRRARRRRPVPAPDGG